MNITDLLDPDRIVCCANAGSKKRILEQLAALLAENAPQTPKNDIFDALINREKLGSTGLGRGVAIPHGRMPSLKEPLCAFIKIDEPLEFDASDGQAVDLVFALLVPEDSTEEHLQVLSTIAEIFSNTVICTALRNCETGQCILEHLYQWESQRISA
ncbi:MAG: PTS IIA-like nitrogen regulatory protein PtsN [Gammaproteobacteria bacterium]|nr:PTS IIA-like nitrogen regulatory protein PtsN [Gammaproteobacteria bacterium]